MSDHNQQARQKQAREEDQFREAERVMLFIDDAARNAGRAAESLRKDGAADYLVSALETAAGAMRAEHSRLMKSVYYPAPEQQPDQEGPEPRAPGKVGTDGRSDQSEPDAVRG